VIGNAVVFASLMVALQIAVSRVSLLTDAAKDVHVHDHEHEHDHAHDHAHEHAEAAKASGVAAGLSAEEEAKLKNSGEKHTYERKARQRGDFSLFFFYFSFFF